MIRNNHNGKTVFITGSSSGIGLALVEVFLEKKWNVIATLRSPSKFPLKESEKLLILPLDVCDEAAIVNAIEKAITRFKKIDLLINNAGYGLFGIFEEISESSWLKQMDVNFFGSLRVTQNILPHMRKQKNGRIIYISSIGGVSAMPASSLYCATKFAIDGFVDSLSYELDGTGVSVKLVLPGAVKTRFWNNSVIVNTEKDEYSRISKKIAELKGGYYPTEASTVAKRIYRLSITKRKKLRYYVTRDAKFVHFLNGFLSDSLKRKLIKFFYFKLN